MKSRIIHPAAVLVFVLVVGLLVVGCANAGQQTPDVDMDMDVENIEQQLQQLRTTIESEAPENYSELEPQVNQLRQTLEQAYEETQMTEAWQELEPQFDMLEQQLRDESDEALATLDTIMEEMRTDLQQQ